MQMCSVIIVFDQMLRKLLFTDFYSHCFCLCVCRVSCVLVCMCAFTHVHTHTHTHTHTQSNPDIAPLFVRHILCRYIEGGAVSKYFVNREFVFADFHGRQLTVALYQELRVCVCMYVCMFVCMYAWKL